VRRVLHPLIAAALVALAGCGSETTTITKTETAKGTSNAATTAAPDPPRQREPIDTNGESEFSCDYQLGDFGDSGDPKKGFRFTATGTLTNTGNVGIKVRVTYKWKQGGGLPPITRRKIYRVRRNETRDVGITVPATSEQIDSIQSVPGKDCSANATIIDSFGLPPYED
jgi:hypothetical protein